MRRSERGLTLLEVMAAVVLLGVLYSFLATKTTQGIWQEYDARNRLEASLVADEVLAELELQLAAGTAITRSTDERELDDYVVITEISDYAHDPTAAATPGAAAGLAGLPNLPGLAAAGVPSVFGSGPSGSPSVVVRISVRVLWNDGIEDHAVVRETFGFDQQMAQQLMGGVAAPVDTL
jgi:prepilin-type N-terminal cleavage/methylation domain-containing protein